MLTVVIPAYTINEEVQKLTEQAIDSVGNVKKIIIDNASPMGGGYLRSRADIYVRNYQNLGYAAACNQGVKLAQTRYVMIVSTDVVLSPNWREVTEEILEGSPPSVFSLHFRMTDYGVPFRYGNEVSENKQRWCTAATFALDKDKGLLFDERFFNSFEDYDLFLRARQKGFKQVYTNKACFQHAHSFTQKFTGFKNTDKNKELFKEIHGDYADVLFEKEFPDQMTIPYYEGFKI